MSQFFSHIDVSVVMSVYNGERYLCESIDSVLGQTYDDFEFIIINDGSTDGTREILESYDDERLVLVHQENMGLTKSLNKGIAMARGKYIARQDADDVSEPERLEKQIAYLESHQEVAVIGSNASYIGPNGQCLGASKYPCEHEAIVVALSSYNCFWHGSTMFLKNAFSAVGGYSDYFIATQDYDLWFRMSSKYKMANLQEPLYRYRFNPDAVTFQRVVTQKKLADLARKLAHVRALGGEESAVLESFADEKNSLTAQEKMEIFSAYRGWVRILEANSLVDEACALAGEIVKYYPSILFRLLCQITSLIDRRRAVKLILDAKV